MIIKRATLHNFKKGEINSRLNVVLVDLAKIQKHKKPPHTHKKKYKNRRGQVETKLYLLTLVSLLLSTCSPMDNVKNIDNGSNNSVKVNYVWGNLPPQKITQIIQFQI